MIISNKLARSAQVVFIIGMLNFAVYVIVASNIGGDAINGHVEGSHYFLASHGKLTETTRTVFEYSRLHTYSVWITHPLAMIGAWISSRWKKQNEEKITKSK